MTNENAISLKQLRALVAINENGSLTAASRRCCDWRRQRFQRNWSCWRKI